MGRFLLDENLSSPVVAEALRQAGHEVVLAGEAGVLEASDELVFARAQELALTVLTQDVEFMNFPLGHHSGIVVLRLSRLAPPAWLERVVKALADEIPDIEGRRAVVNEHRTRIRRL